MMSDSIVYGPLSPPLQTVTLGKLIDKQSRQYGDKTQLIFPYQKARLSFKQLAERSKALAKALLAVGFQAGDKVGIFAANRYEYIDFFLAAARIGCPSVVFSTTYTPRELYEGAKFTKCKAIFTASHIGDRKLSEHIAALSKLSGLQSLILLDHDLPNTSSRLLQIQYYDTFIASGSHFDRHDVHLHAAAAKVKPHDVVNIQFTSGTTGSPKGAQLTHHGLINNAQLLGHKLKLAPQDVLVAPTPLFHCFSLVGSFLMTYVHGATVVFPSEVFNPEAVIDAVIAEKATLLHSVPTMFVAEIEVARRKGVKIETLRTGLAAGSPVPLSLMKQIEDVLGMKNVVGGLGMTETSPVSFVNDPSDLVERRTASLGKAMPHTAAKIVDKDGRIVKKGVKGELCIGGYLLMKGYLHNKVKTDEVLRPDDQGVLWMHTGDECFIDEQDYCYITGRIKDIIIRGGENIYPGEIEGRLAAHPAIAEASVVGLKDKKYGEAVATFLRAADKAATRPSDADIRDWIRQSLGRHKAPQHVFWLGDAGVGDDYPKTGSGKYQKFLLMAIGNKLVEEKDSKAMWRL